MYEIEYGLHGSYMYTVGPLQTMHVYTFGGLEIFPSCLSILCLHIHVHVVVFDGGSASEQVLDVHVS